MRIGLLIDGSGVTRWQAEAIAELGREHSYFVYNCINPGAPKRRVWHWPYYLLNLVSIRSARTRRVALPESAVAADRFDFACLEEDLWQRLPDALLERMAADRVELIVKFGLGLLRVPDPSQLPVPILSYHHGNPSHFRGRPAGFYELLTGCSTLGQVVQILSNSLDAGKVVAFAETRAHPHSYKLTLAEAYAVSPLLLPKAIDAVREGRHLDLQPKGKVTMLPSPWTVVRFVLQRTSAKVRRLAYGAFVEKRWQVAAAPPVEARDFGDFPPSAKWRFVERPAGYRFLADPFPHPAAEGILVEALRSSSGLGEVLHLSATGTQSVLGGAGHFSYPSSIVTGDGAFLTPEVSEWSEPRLYRIDAEHVTPVNPLKFDRRANLIDPTFYEHEGTTYLFANILSEGDTVLRLWHAPSLHDRFEEHAASPILLSPKGARMGGMLFKQDGSLFRLGQDGSGGYGDGILLFQVEEITPTTYRERLVDTLRFADFCGPHTLNRTPDGVVFDFYRHQFAPLAGIRRLKGRLARRSQSPSDA